MITERFTQSEDKQPIRRLRKGTRFEDCNGNRGHVTRHATHCTWVKITDPAEGYRGDANTCYANCADVIPIGQAALGYLEEPTNEEAR